MKNWLKYISQKLDALKSTVDSHTGTLDFLVKQTKDWNVEMTVVRERMERHEAALKALGEKLNLDISPLLHP